MENKEGMRTRRWYKENGLVDEEPKAKVTKIDIEKYPVVKFYGKIEYYTTFDDIALASDKLLNEVKESKDDIFPLGFDMEWPFSFKTGPGKTALIQICPNKRICYLFQVSLLTKLPAALTALLGHERVKLCGVNIRNDIHKLGRDFPNIPKELLLDNCIDSRTQAKEISELRSWSMEKLVNYFLKMQIDKNKKIRMSQWHVIPLSDDQQKYAAIDAFISLSLFKHLKSLIKRAVLEEKQLNEQDNITPPIC